MEIQTARTQAKVVIVGGVATERAVRTPSSEQVRRPIFTSGLDYWRNYEPWLEPLKEALGEGVRQRFGIGLEIP